MQTGIGRTGAWFAHQRDRASTPDVVTLAKGLGGGFPIGACVALGDGGRRCSSPGNHGTTFGGNPVACAAALAVLDTIEKDGLLEHATASGERLRAGLAADERVHRGPRTRACSIGLDLSRPLSAEEQDAVSSSGTRSVAATTSASRLPVASSTTAARKRSSWSRASWW